MNIKTKTNLKKAVLLTALLAAAFLAGRGIAYIKYEKIDGRAIPASGSVSGANWGLGFGQEGSQPTGNATSEELQQYDAHYVGDSTEKVIYLTFDAGYENGNTQPILDALKKHNVPATFFVVGHYLESAPDLVKQMVADGHFVGNHTYHHLDMSSIASKESFEKEMRDVETLFKEITGTELAPFYRPPQENTTPPICRWQRRWATTPSSGVLPMSTGIRTSSRHGRKPSRSLSGASTRAPSSCCTALPRPTARSSTNCCPGGRRWATRSARWRILQRHQNKMSR